MIGALRAAGFPGVEAGADGVIYARLWSASVEFTARPEGEAGWRLSLSWPLRASAAQIAGWNAAHPLAPMDLHLGETRLSMLVAAPEAPALTDWATLAEAAVAECIRWRRAQRAPGEGM